MITFHHMQPMCYEGTENTIAGAVCYCEGACISTDPKPTEGIYNGSKLCEMDTGKRYMYDADTGDWMEWTP